MAISRYAILALCIGAAISLWIMGGILKWIYRYPMVPTGGVRPLGAITLIRWLTKQGHRFTNRGRECLGGYVGIHYPTAFSRLERVFVP